VKKQATSKLCCVRKKILKETDAPADQAWGGGKTITGKKSYRSKPGEKTCRKGEPQKVGIQSFQVWDNLRKKTLCQAISGGRYEEAEER